MTAAAAADASASVVVAIPARDEAERIGGCLQALAGQTRPPDGVVLLANNCRDATAAVAEALAPVLPFALHVIRHDFPPEAATAGQARHRVMAQAADHAGPNGWLLTTDADGIPAPDWVECTLHAFAAGADAVCGCIVADPAEAALIPDHLRADDVLETTLLALLDELAARVDPDPADPWPRHTQAAGASLAATVTAFRRVGGIPPLPAGEDRAFVAALARIDAAIRHDPAVVVTVSARQQGRTLGGMADTIRRRMVRQDEWTDDSVEPAVDAFRRLDFRRRVRHAWTAGAAVDPALAIDLGIEPGVFRTALRQPAFGAAWQDLQACSPFLHRRRVRFTELPRQIDYARQLLASLSPVHP